ncbi:MAG: isoprenylcysteine carboxylmethyltransferase family protein [Planctomycetia bacterium]|nr:isoprenylcysteine carboxylmethyltransferase family protein [Planctomycetia bacterium]
MSLAATQPSSSRFQSVLALLVRRRVALSIGLFTALVVRELIANVRPLDVISFNQWPVISGTLLVLCGVLLRSWAAGTLTKMQQLTTTGPYRLVRNPLYLGSFMMMVGFLLILGDWWNMLAVVPVIVLYTAKVRDEEKWLRAKFGTAFDEYAKRTPRFIPRSLPDLHGNWRLAQWVKNREYQACFSSFVALAVLQLWHNGSLGI